MTPESAPTVLQLLAFYLEAGVDCALTEAPVNRLSDSRIGAAARQTVLPNPVRTIPAATPAPRVEAAPAPEAAILSAREAARTAPTLAALRELLEKIRGLRAQTTRHAVGIRRRQPARAHHVRRRGPRARGRHRGAAVRRPFR